MFVSYRRADGVYAVGWLAARLRLLDLVNGVETAFHDSTLRAGDDFPDALQDELDQCDLVIAVISPEWYAARDGELRIKDPDDWVVREIATAFSSGTRVLPILIGGAEHPLASQLHDSIADLTRLHTLPFTDGNDLDTIVEHIESHLEEIDIARARLAGLEQPVEVPKLQHPWRIAAGAALTGIVFGVAMGFSSMFDVVDGDCTKGKPFATCVQDTSAFDWLGVVLVALGVFAGITAVVGGVLAWRLSRVVDVEWQRTLGILGLIFVTIFLLGITSGSGQFELREIPGFPNIELRFVTISVVVVPGAVALGFCMAAARFSSPKALPHRIGERVRYLGIARDAERWGAALLAAQLALVAAGGSMVLLAFQQSDADEASANPLPSIVFALMCSTIIIFTHVLSISRFRNEQHRIEQELQSLPPRYRANAKPKLIATTFDDGGWGFRTFLALPLIVTLLMSTIIVFSGT